MTHPKVDQLRFTRSEWRRALRGVPESDALRRFEPMNSIGWIVGHLAWHEQRYWLTRAQGLTPVPQLDETVGYGAPPSTPPLRQMLAAWRRVTGASDPWLDRLATADLLEPLAGRGPRRSVGDALQRVTYHYWFHIGEIVAIRQLLDHPRRPEFVGSLEGRARYRPDPP